MPPSSAVKGTFMEAARDYRVWALFVIYGACFGVELTINNIAALYYYDHFQLNLGTAGVIAGLYGVMNIFARTLGGVFGDRAGIKFGLKGRAMFLGIVLLGEGVTLILFSQMASLLLAVSAMMVFSLFVKMAQGATFSVVPFINRRALGSVAGIVGAGGNTGAVAFGFLFRSESLSTNGALFIVGIAVVLASGMVFAVRFSGKPSGQSRWSSTTLWRFGPVCLQERRLRPRRTDAHQTNPYSIGGSVSVAPFSCPCATPGLHRRAAGGDAIMSPSKIAPEVASDAGSQDLHRRGRRIAHRGS